MVPTGIESFPVDHVYSILLRIEGNFQATKSCFYEDNFIGARRGQSCDQQFFAILRHPGFPAPVSQENVMK